MSAPAKPWCWVWVGGEHGVGATELTDYVAEGLTLSGGSTVPFDTGDALVCAFQVVTSSSDSLTRPQIGDEVFVAGAPPTAEALELDSFDNVRYSVSRLFFGFVSDISEQQLTPDGLTVWTINAVDPIGLLAQVSIGAEPWTRDTLAGRVGDVETAINTALGSPWWVDVLQNSYSRDDPYQLTAADTSASATVHYRDVDNVNALDLLRQYADVWMLAAVGTELQAQSPPTGVSHAGNLGSWRVRQKISSRLRFNESFYEGTVNYTDPAQVPIQWVKYGARTGYSRRTVVTDWQVDYGPKTESLVDVRGDQVGEEFYYELTTTSTASDTPGSGQAVYYDGTDSSSDDEKRLRVHKTDKYGNDRAPYLRGIVVSDYVSTYEAEPTTTTTGRAYYIRSATERADWFDIIVDSTSSGYYPTSYTLSKLYIVCRHPTRSAVAATDDALPGRRSRRRLQTELFSKRVADTLAARLTDATKTPVPVVDQLQILCTAGMDLTAQTLYYGFSATDCWRALFNQAPQLLQGLGRDAFLLTFDPTAGTPADTETDYVSLGGSLVAAQDGWVFTLSVIQADAYCEWLRPDTYLHLGMEGDLVLT